jgi:hypothetical protein
VPAEIKFPKNIMQTPVSTVTPLIQQTPFSAAFTMYNYFNALSSRLQHSQNKIVAREVDQLIFVMIDKVLK